MNPLITLLDGISILERLFLEHHQFLVGKEVSIVGEKK
jgi:hypothetical protein